MCIRDRAKGVEDVSAQRDPVGRILSGETNPKGLKVEKITVPMGVIGIIYEARPNVTSDAAALCLMAGSAVILRGGKEAFRSNNAIAEVLRDAIESADLPRDSVQLVQDTSREMCIRDSRCPVRFGRGFGFGQKFACALKMCIRDRIR